jgi:hypothetical protein
LLSKERRQIFPHCLADNTNARNVRLVMPGLVQGIHVLIAGQIKDVDGRDKPGHDVEIGRSQRRLV